MNLEKLSNSVIRRKKNMFVLLNKTDYFLSLNMRNMLFVTLQILCSISVILSVFFDYIIKVNIKVVPLHLYSMFSWKQYWAIPK